MFLTSFRKSWAGSKFSSHFWYGRKLVISYLIISSNVANRCDCFREKVHGVELSAACLAEGIQPNPPFSKSFERSSWAVSIYPKIRSLCDKGNLKGGLQILKFMNVQDIEAYQEACVCLLQSCTKMRSLEEGRQIHELVIKNLHLENRTFINNTIMNMYIKCGKIELADKIFEQMIEPNIFSWTIMISGYVHQGHSMKALSLFKEMQQKRMKPDKVTFLGVLNACAMIATLAYGKQIHAFVLKARCQSVISVCNTLIDMYAKCGNIKDAWEEFERLPLQDNVSWNVMLAGYVHNGLYERTLELFQQIDQDYFQPNNVTFATVLHACSIIGALSQGKYIHAVVVSSGCEADVFVGTNLFDMYANCDIKNDAWKIFRKLPTLDVVSWSTIISCLVQDGHCKEALNMFHLMRCEGLKADNVTLSTVLAACAGDMALMQGKLVHAIALVITCKLDFVICGSLVDMYLKCGGMEDAFHLFNRISNNNVFSWTTMICGYAQYAYFKHALKVFSQMQENGVKPNAITFVSILGACADSAALEAGKWIHAQTIKGDCADDTFVTNALADMYAKCGSICIVHQVFDRMLIRNVVSWNGLISACAQHGNGIDAIKLFKIMQQEGLKPNEITFISIMTACGHACLVDEGIHYFTYSGFSLSVDHYACLIDLLGRRGFLDEAMDMMSSMTIETTPILWTSLFGNCRLYCNVHLSNYILNIFFYPCQHFL